VYLAARLLLGGAFVVFGLRNIKAIPGLARALEARHLPLPVACAAVGVGLQIAGGLLTAIGPWAWLGGMLLIVFIVLATLLFHPFWEYSGEERKPHLQSAIMNTGLLGAFLMVVATGW
jgi:putative oxidoreductase